ncbi:MAG: metallophosphoesterase, partial [Candidatus Aminicenantes bacterium]|nr:metallophosphoesterase [Candidatus Aminicenantes bacterium]
MARRAGRLGRPSAAALVLAALLLATACSVAAVPAASGRPQAAADPWRFAVISDTQGDNKDTPGKSGLNDEVVKALAEAIVREKIDFLLVSGDLTSGWFKNGGTPYETQYANWRKAMQPVFRAGIPVFPIRGNHDDGPERLAL